MINYFFRKKTEEALRTPIIRKSQAVPSDVCKRAVGLFPDNANRVYDPKDTVTLRFHHLLISLEGAERTGCLKISSHHAKSRSAILLYRGRVVGAVWGRKFMQGQYLHEDAHKCAMSDLATPGNLLDAYELPEELVLAAASLFYGQTLDTNNGQAPAAMLESAINSIIRSGLPGCVVVNTSKEETICIVYIGNGKIAGVFSAQDGWTHANAESAKRFLQGKECRVHASVLPLSENSHVGFSLSGLADRGASTTSNAYLDFSPPSPSAQVRTPSREAVAEAVRQHRGSREHARPSRSYARI